MANPVSITGVDGQTGAVSFSKRYCVPDSSGPARQVDAVARCWDIAAASLDANGKPQFNTARTGGLTCPCQFIDWDHDTNGGHVPGYAVTNSPTNGLTYINGASGHPMYRGPAPIVTSAASFGDGSATAKGWWTDNTYNGNSHTIGNLELSAIGTGQYQFSSKPSLVLGGFFPLDPAGQFPLYTATPTGPGTVHTVGTEAMVCNLWPYWYSSTQLRRGQRVQGRPVPLAAEPDDHDERHRTSRPTGTRRSTRCTPTGTGTRTSRAGTTTTGSPTRRAPCSPSTAPFTLNFYGADDTFIYINGILVSDLGGVHQAIPAQVSVDANGFATIIEGGSLNAAGTAILPCATTTLDPYTQQPFDTLTSTDGNGHSNCTSGSCDCRTRTANLGLAVGSTYEIAIFGANRHPTESSYQLTLSGLTSNESQCGPRCGDGLHDRGRSVRLRRRDDFSTGRLPRPQQRRHLQRLLDVVHLRSFLRRRHGQRLRAVRRRREQRRRLHEDVQQRRLHVDLQAPELLRRWRRGRRRGGRVRLRERQWRVGIVLHGGLQDHHLLDPPCT